MNKIKVMDNILILYDFPFLAWIYTRCLSKNIGIIEKFWFGHWYCRFFHYQSLDRRNCTLYDLYYKNAQDNKILYF